MILRRGPLTAEIALISVVLSWVVGIPVAIVSALRPNSIADSLARFVSILFLAVPGFWLGMLIVLALLFWFGYRAPMAGASLFADPVANLQIVIGPAIVLGLGQAAYIARMARSSLLEVIREDYVRTARAKGLNSRLVISLHALPNALLPVITLSGILLGFVLAGSIPVERAFGTPGLGYRDVHRGQRARRLRHAEPGVPLRRRVRAAEHRGRSHHRLARPEDPLPMTATDPDQPVLPRRAVAHAIARAAPSAAASRRFFRRAPLSAFWGCVAAAIIAHGGRRAGDGALRAAQIRFPLHEQAADEKHWFGTDQIGRDMLSRVIYGSRASLTVAIGAVLFGTTLGALWGLACGYFGGRFDMLSQRIIEFLQSFPDLILAMAIAMALGGGMGTVIVAIAITRIPFGGRVIRSVVLSLKEMQYVEAARGLGASHLRLMFRHILPQCVAPYLILATTHLGVAIVIEASLGFLGVGIPPPTPTWGNMLADSLNAGLVPPWWLVLFPGAGDHRHRAGLQPARRRHPRHARPPPARLGLSIAGTRQGNALEIDPIDAPGDAGNVGELAAVILADLRP